MKNVDYLLIEKYLSEELTSEELIEFKTRLENDNDFALEVNLYSEINQTLTSRRSNFKEENDLRNTLEDLGKEFVANNQSSVDSEQLVVDKKSKIFSLKPYIKFIAVAASVILIVSIFRLNGNLNYNDFANHQQLDLVVRGTTDEHLTIAQDAFNAKDYEIAEKELRTVLYADNSNTEVQLYLGVSLLEQDKFELAEATFNTLKNGKSIYKNKAIWYLALTKLKQKDYKNCELLLKLIPKDSEDYGNAKKLLRKL